MIEKIDNNNNIYASIPTKYLSILNKLLDEKQFGTFSLIIQKGKITGCDTTIKERSENK